MRKVAGLLAAATLISAVHCGEEKPDTTLLRVEGDVYSIDDFIGYFDEDNNQIEEGMDRELLEGYLNKFLEQKILVYAATQAGIEEPEGIYSRPRLDAALIGEYLSREAKNRRGTDPTWLRRVEKRIEETQSESYKEEERYEIRTIYLATEREANEALRRIRANSRRFDGYLDRNPEQMKQSKMGQGIHTSSQIPENARNQVLELADRVKSRNRPAITDKIPINDGKNNLQGFLIIQLVRVLPRAAIEEDGIRAVVEEKIESIERELLRQELLEELLQKLDIEFKPEIALGKLAGESGG